MQAPASHRTLFSIFVACAAYASFNVGDAAIKALGSRFHFSEIIFVGGLLNLFFLTAYGAATQGRAAFVSASWRSVALRVVFLQAMAVCEILSLSHVQLTTFYTLIFTSPFMVAVMLAVFLKEPLGLRRLGVIAAGFAIVMFVFRPGSGLANIYVPVTLMAAFCYSAQLVATRQLSGRGKEEGPCCVFVATSLAGLVWSGPVLCSHYIAPAPFEWLLFFVYSGFGMLGYVAVNHAFRIAPAAAALAPCHYTQIGWAALIGWLVFRETPDVRVITGAGLLIILGLYLIWSEARSGKA